MFSQCSQPWLTSPLHEWGDHYFWYVKRAWRYQRSNQNPYIEWWDNVKKIYFVNKYIILRQAKQSQHGKLKRWTVPRRKTRMLARCWLEQMDHKYLSRSLLSHIWFVKHTIKFEYNISQTTRMLYVRGFYLKERTIWIQIYCLRERNALFIL